LRDVAARGAFAVTPPRILYLTPGCFDKGGISRYCRYQISALRDLYGAENVSALSLMGPDENGFEEPFYVAWHGASKPNALWRGLLAARAARAALTFRPRVIHVAHVNYVPLAVQLARLSGARTVLNVYGLEIWSNLAAHRRAAMRKMDLIIADCHFTGDYVLAEAMHAAPPAVIWDCVDLARFTPAPCPPAVLAKYGIPAKAGEFVVLTLGRLARGASHKGYDRLVHAFARMPQTARKATLVIAGRGDLRADLEALVRDLGVADRVHFTGSVDEADLADVYRSASVFSLVSDRGHARGEGIPLTPLEAMACGAPVIVGNHDGSQEAVVGGANGFVIDPFDIDRHAAIMADLSDDPDKQTALSRAARKVAETDFGFEGFRDKHAECYRDLLSAAPALSPAAKV